MKSIRNDFISDINWHYLRNYFTGSTSLFRHYQNLFLACYGTELHGSVVELGSERQYNHQRFFPNADKFITTNIKGDVDLILDITDMKGFSDNSQDAYVCVSVLEHVLNLEKAISEIHRTLKSDGKLLLTMPFAFPHHDVVDYWRLNSDAYEALFKGFETHRFIHLGGVLSAVANVLQRPKGKLTPRYTVYKSVGLLVALLAKGFDTQDGFPLGYGLYAIKK